jgi:hypothetical protein
MHLSFSQDMLSLSDFLHRTKSLSASQIASMVERGTI